MIKNYNGKINRALLRDLKRLCVVNAKSLQNLMEAYERKGKVSFYINCCPCTGLPDEMSEKITLKSETEIREYLKDDFQQKADRVIGKRAADSDFLVHCFIEFVKENGGFLPTKDEMRQIEQKAEAQRLAELSSSPETSEQPPEEGDKIIEEILELAEDIVDARWEAMAKKTDGSSDQYPLYIKIRNNYFSGCIRTHDICSFKRYFVSVDVIHTDIHIQIYYTNNNRQMCYIRDRYDDTIRKKDEIRKHLVTLHQVIAEMAKGEEIEFTSEVDYQKFLALK